MKIYDHPQAPNPRRVRIFLAEKGVSVPLETVDILRRVNREPAFLARNPFGGIPVLELDDGSCIAESVAICRYFEGEHPDPPLFGKGAREQAEVEMWNRRVELGLLAAIGMVWAHGSPLTAAVIAQIPANVEPNRKRAAQVMEIFDRALAERPFLAGERFSIADISALCAIDFGRALVDVHPDPALQHLGRWHRDVSSRPSARA
jgi:glutathione S-transferase